MSVLSKKSDVLFIITRVNYDHRTRDESEKYSLPVSKKDNEEWQVLFEKGQASGNGFHEGMNFLEYKKKVYIYLKPSRNRASCVSLTKRGYENGRVCLITVAKSPDTGRDYIVGMQANLKLVEEALIRPDHRSYKNMEKIEYHAEGPSNFSTLTGESVETDLAPSRGYKYLSREQAVSIFYDLLNAPDIQEQKSISNAIKDICASCFGKTFKFKASSSSKSDYKRRKSGSSKTAQEDFEYLSSRRTIKVTAKHKKIQEKMVLHLKKSGFVDIEENYYNVDIKAKKLDKVYFFEIKPTEVTRDCKEAVRYAVGQLFDYQHWLNHDANLCVVLGCEPSPEHKKFLKYVGIDLVYFDASQDNFV